MLCYGIRVFQEPKSPELAKEYERYGKGISGFFAAAGAQVKIPSKDIRKIKKAAAKVRKMGHTDLADKWEATLERLLKENATYYKPPLVKSAFLRWAGGIFAVLIAIVAVGYGEYTIAVIAFGLGVVWMTVSK